MLLYIDFLGRVFLCLSPSLLWLSDAHSGERMRAQMLTTILMYRERSGYAEDAEDSACRCLQVVAEAATGAVQRWIQLNDEATARIMKREEHIEWLRKLFTGWKEARPALRESQEEG